MIINLLRKQKRMNIDATGKTTGTMEINLQRKGDVIDLRRKIGTALGMHTVQREKSINDESNLAHGV